MKHIVIAILYLSVATSMAEAGSLQQKPVNIRYGPDPLQSFDLYTFPEAVKAPIIVMVHGGAWKFGDKASSSVVRNKLAYWQAKGYLFASVNYRMVPKADPYEQALDVARALAKLQSIAAQYHGDSKRIILMGHSAGGHLVALLSADPSIAKSQGAKRWRGSVLLDSGALDTAKIMQRSHMSFYDDAFGSDPTFWAKISPIESIKAGAIPMLVVCSTKREVTSCSQARAFAEKLKIGGNEGIVVPVDMTHHDINEKLGLAGTYTDAVNDFIAAQLK